ncbi:2-isopropylmalate synthase (Alpha-isopropylmalate synthase) (Alpha-IPM synthetase) [Tieghemiomyces parasiticus]|uniref:2-isopropylmalate synthase n=1 Tax=Tieghemiomyces parasiticus TaxID=78921 RepID=A0A9W8A9V4_9FUNG|nr:2-isopropylmalate synthase (Alpha-isopropylmalate synthase) (Alpha-IPM synthetase) [Tieghemiomyces parasiticus]
MIEAQHSTPAMRTLYLSDTTLRDGEQAPDINFNTDDKVAIAKELSKLGIDEIDAGFPASSEHSFKSTQRIAREVGPLMEGRDHIGYPITVVALARATESDIDRAYEAIKDAPRFAIRLFIATSDIHLEHKLQITREECLVRVARAARHARQYTPNVHFGPEDGSRTDLAFLCEVYQVAIDSGVSEVYIMDTVGSSIPTEIAEVIKYCKANVKYDASVRWGVHVHNDLGLATANTLACIEAGIDIVDGTMSGIGERAGNVSIEEIAMVLTMHQDHYGVKHRINTRNLTRVCRMVTEMGGTAMAPNKPIVGQNVFRHTSGIHQHGLLRNRSTYEYLDPEMVGATSDGLILSKLSGRSAFQARLERLKIDHLDLSPDRLNILFAKFKILAEDRTEVTDADLRGLVKA